MNSAETSTGSVADYRAAVRANYVADEATVIRELIASLRLSLAERKTIAAAGAKETLHHRRRRWWSVSGLKLRRR